jgi:hypothetical protein
MDEEKTQDMPRDMTLPNEQRDTTASAGEEMVKTYDGLVADFKALAEAMKNLHD